jgi:outer membrane receptor protein involved in Fe transport
MRPIRNQEFTIRSFVKRSYRMPSFNDLYYTLVGNSNLAPEDAWQYDLSFDFRKGISSAWSLAAKADFYYNSVKDKIIAIPTSNQFRWTMFNIGKTEILGSETVLSIRHSGSIASGIMIKYTYQQARDRSNPSSASYNGQIPYIPLNSGSLNADVTFKGWTVLYSLLANGKRWSSAANIEDYEIDPWVTQDLAISKSVGNITLNLALNNLSNRQYQVVQGYPMPGFNLMASIGYDF